MSEYIKIMGLTVLVIWGFLISIGVLFIGWDLFRDWDAHRRIKNLIAAEAENFLKEREVA